MLLERTIAFKISTPAFFRLSVFLLTFLFTRIGAAQNNASCRDSLFNNKVDRLLRYSVPVIDVDSLQAKMGKYQILDARAKDEFRVSHIPGAQWVGYKDFDNKRVDSLSRSSPVVIYCSVGYRSEKIAERLRKKGFEQVYNLYGSIFEWVNRDYSVVRADSAATDSIHTYNKEWSQWVKNPEAIKVY